MFSPFPAPAGCPHSFAHGLSFPLQSQSQQLSPFYAAISLLSPTPTLKDPRDYIVSLQTIQENLSIKVILLPIFTPAAASLPFTM